MPYEIFKYPEGYEVKVLRKKDVLTAIEENIIDKEIAYELIKHLEIDATNFLKEGRWAGIPFIGNIRIPRAMEKARSAESKEILNNAKNTLSHEEYLLFRKDYYNDCGRRAKEEKMYEYLVSKFVGKYYNCFKHYAKRKGNIAARVICYTLSKPILDYEQLQDIYR